ncbi:MAG: hypothetical protein V2A53_08085 [bacterium]
MKKILGFVLILGMVLGLYGQVAQADEGGYEFVWKQPSISWYFASPSGVAVDSSGNFYVADTDNHCIQKFSSSGTFITKWGSEGTENGQFYYTSGVTVDSSDNLYVTDSTTTASRSLTQTELLQPNGEVRELRMVSLTYLLE